MYLHIAYTQMQKKRDLIDSISKTLMVESPLVFDIDLGSSVGFGPRLTKTVPICQSAVTHVREPMDSCEKTSLSCSKYSINVD